jgi:hypothetical protein
VVIGTSPLRAGVSMSMFETGVAARSGARADPIEHLLVRGGTGKWVTWCGGGPAIEGFVSIRRRRCPKCVALARADLVELEVPDDEESDLDWFLGREVVRNT